MSRKEKKSKQGLYENLKLSLKEEYNKTIEEVDKLDTITYSNYAKQLPSLPESVQNEINVIQSILKEDEQSKDNTCSFIPYTHDELRAILPKNVMIYGSENEEKTGAIHCFESGKYNIEESETEDITFSSFVKVSKGGVKHVIYRESIPHKYSWDGIDNSDQLRSTAGVVTTGSREVREDLLSQPRYF